MTPQHHPEDTLPSSALSALDALESEAIHILREVAGEAERPVLLFSGGKDSACLLHLTVKAFSPGPFPFPLLHIDTGHNFPELLGFRDRRARELGARLHVWSIDEAAEQGILPEPKSGESRNQHQIPVLLAALEHLRADVAIGGARRDEEKARAKERIFSVRDAFGQWEPRRQRPELWNLYNARPSPDGQLRVFPLSNWTEQDVWAYVVRERLALPEIYYAHERDAVRRDGQWLPVNPFDPPRPGETVERRRVRVRTIGDMPCTGLVDSPADSPQAVLRELLTTRTTERGARADDRVSAAAMEDRKRKGYF